MIDLLAKLLQAQKEVEAGGIENVVIVLTSTTRPSIIIHAGTLGQIGAIGALETASAMIKAQLAQTIKPYELGTAIDTKTKN